MAKLPSPSSPRTGKQGRRPVRRPIWPPWTTAAAGGGGKGARGAWGSIPQLTSARGVARERGDVNRRRRAEMAAAAAL